MVSLSFVDSGTCGSRCHIRVVGGGGGFISCRSFREQFNVPLADGLHWWSQNHQYLLGNLLNH